MLLRLKVLWGGTSRERGEVWGFGNSGGGGVRTHVINDKKVNEGLKSNNSNSSTCKVSLGLYNIQRLYHIKRRKEKSEEEKEERDRDDTLIDQRIMFGFS